MSVALIVAGVVVLLPLAPARRGVGAGHLSPGRRPVGGLSRRACHLHGGRHRDSRQRNRRADEPHMVSCEPPCARPRTPPSDSLSGPTWLDRTRRANAARASGWLCRQRHVLRGRACAAEPTGARGAGRRAGPDLAGDDRRASHDWGGREGDGAQARPSDRPDLASRSSIDTYPPRRTMPMRRRSSPGWPSTPRARFTTTRVRGCRVVRAGYHSPGRQRCSCALSRRRRAERKIHHRVRNGSQAAPPISQPALHPVKNRRVVDHAALVLHLPPS